jgi:glycerate 2-kinase
MRPSWRGANAPANLRSCEGADTGEALDPRRELLLALLRSGLERVDGRRCVARALQGGLGPAPVWVAAVGKAAPAMTLGAYEALGPAIRHSLVITRDAEALQELTAHTQAEVWLGSHPLPDERSLAAGARLLEWVDGLPPDAMPLFLISGGASSLVEVPEEGATLEDFLALTRLSFTSGMPIGELNARRAALSRIKGGRLAAQLHGRAARALFVSDVPHDDPRVIGSGLMGPAAAGDNVAREVVASVDHAVAAIAGAAGRFGLSVQAPRGRFEGPAARLAARFAHELRLSGAQLCVWGGESTVELPAHPGRGGRNQHLALAAARLIAGQGDLLLLAAGTDGSDGVTEDAGALVDGETCARLALAELDADRCLREADSGRALAASGDLLHTGPTGTNVGDVVIGLKLPLESARALARAHGGSLARVL